MIPTTPATAVESVDADTVENALEGIFGDGEPQEEQQEQAQEGQADENGVEPGDIPDDDENAPQPESASEFELVHNGQQLKLPRDEVVKLAQQGFDYTQKTQALAERARAAEAVLQRATAVEQMMPALMQDLATVQALGAQLAQYDRVDWVGLATNDPLEYPKVRAQYDQVVNAYQRANTQYQQRANAVATERSNLTAYQLQQEAAALRERIPEWRDPEKFQAGSQELRNYLINQGANPYDVDTLSSSLAVSIARKAMLYDKLRADKAAKSKQVRNAPPVVKPGAANADSGKTNFAKAKQEIRRMGQRGQNKAQEKLMEGLLSRVFK